MKIGLIAMSGIRVCNTELLEMGLTLPGFVERSKTIASLPSLGLLTLAALTPEEHDVVYLEVEDLRHLDTLPSDLDLVALSSFSAQINEAYALADGFRAMGVPVVMGGLHVTSLPEEALSHSDAIVIGEGEPVWADLVEDAAAGALKPVYDGRTCAFDLKEAPIPAYELLDLDRYNRLTVQTSRGCPHHCEFCASSILLTDRYKQKPIENVLREIDAIKALWKHPFIEFADDNAFVNHKYWKELLPQLAERRVRWFAETDLSVARDPELLDMMRESGCAQVLIGLESPVPAGLDGLEINNNWKRKRYDEYRTAIDAIQSRGISVNGCFVIGLDGHTTDIFDDVITFVKESGLLEVQVTILTPFPGTPLYERLGHEGRLTHPGEWNRCTLFDLNYQPSDMSVDELEQGFRNMASTLYGDDMTAERRSRFKSILRSIQRERTATALGGVS